MIPLFIFVIPTMYNVPLRVGEHTIGDWTANSDGRNTECIKAGNKLGIRGNAMTCYKLVYENLTLWQWFIDASSRYDG